MTDAKSNQICDEAKEVEHHSAKAVDGPEAMSATNAGASQDSQSSLNAGSTNFNATNEFQKPSRTFAKGKDIRETPKYHDEESYLSQRSHHIGIGLFNADNIEDLPPRYRKKVLNAYEWLSATFPQANMTAEDLIALDTNNSFTRPTIPPPKPPPGFQNFRGQHANIREGQNQPNSSHVINTTNGVESPPPGFQNFRGKQANLRENQNQPNSHVINTIIGMESSNHVSYTNQNGMGRTNSVREEPKPGTSRDSSTGSKHSNHSKGGPKYNNKSDGRGVPYQDYKSFDGSSYGNSNNSSKQYCDTKSLPKQHRIGDELASHKSSDLSKGTDGERGFQSVHSSERFPPAREVDRNLQNKHSKQSSRNENRPQNKLPNSQSFVTDEKQFSDRSQNNSFKPIVNERSSKFSDVRNTSRTEHPNTSRKNFKKNLVEDGDPKFRSDNSYENSHNRTNLETSSIASDQRFQNDKRSRNSSVSSSKSFNSLKNSKINESASADISKDHADSSNASSSYKKGASHQDKSPFDGRNTNVSNSKLKSPSKRQKSNRGKSPVSERGKGVINEKYHLSNNSCDSSGTFSNCDQSKITDKNPKEDHMDEHMKRVLDFLDSKREDHKVNHTDALNAGKKSEYPGKELINRASTDIDKDVAGSKFNRAANNIQANHSQYAEKGDSLKFKGSKNRRENIQNDKRHSRQNSQCSVSSDKFDANRTHDNVSSANSSLHNSQSDVNFNRTDSNFLRDSFRKSDLGRSTSYSNFNSSKNFEDKKQTDRRESSRVSGPEKHTSDKSRNSPRCASSTAEAKQRNCKDERLEAEEKSNKCVENGFFVSVNVSDNSNKEENWKKFFTNALKHNQFILDSCCKFTDSLTLSFEEKGHAIEALNTLRRLKQRKIVPGEPHLILVGNVKYRRLRPCDCQNKMVHSCLIYFKEFSEKYIQEHQSKMVDIEDELRALRRGKRTKFHNEQKKVLEVSLRMLEDMERVFRIYIDNLKRNLTSAPPNYFYICKLKGNFMRECHSFQRCLPIYSRKDDILKLLIGHSVTIISAETGSGKSTQLAEYLLQSWMAERGTIICTQPRKIAAISITNYVCGQIGSAVGKLIGFDVGTEKKYDKDTKIIYMTDYALLRKFIRNPKLKGISCVIIDEAHERTLHTDLLLGMLKECVKLEYDRLDLRVVITSATIDPSVFVRYFSFLKTAVIDVPGRAYPVEVVWLNENIEIGWEYLKTCVKTAVKIHTEEPPGDVLVFLTSPGEIDEAIAMFRDKFSGPQMPMLMSLHGKSDLQEQMRIFEVLPGDTRKIIFATNAAETSLTIPGIRYVIDCGMAKEMTYFPAKNKNCLMVNFINKSSAEQRKGRAGRTQPGKCYRMYSELNYKEMADRASPEILRTSLQSALLKIYELGFKPDKFEFVESPSKESIAKSLESLELLNLVKDGRLTDLGRKVVELPIEPRLAKLVLQGLSAGVGYEMIIIAAMLREAGRLFVRADDIKVLADQKKIGFCQEDGDLCTYLEVYKRWKEVAQNERYNWCVENFISSKALNSAEKTIKDVVVSLHVDLSLHVVRRYNNAAFKANFENIVFNCFSENLCMYSGHPKVGYFSFLLNDSLYIHPSSSLYYLGKDLPLFLVYSTLMQTSQNFLMDVTPIKESVLNKSYHKGHFNMSADVLKSLKVLPKTIGPFGDIVLRNHIIGKGGSRIVNLEVMIEKLTNSRNFKIDVVREKGTIVIYSEGRFHEKISQHIDKIVKEAQSYLAKEEEIIKMTEGFFYICIGSGGIVNDIIMPGEFREVIVENVGESQLNEVEACLKSCGDLKISRKTNTRKGRCKNFQIAATYMKVAMAQEAKQKLSQKNCNVKSNNFVQESNEKEAPIYRIQASWSRALSDGTGWVEFDSEADCIGASGKLTANSFFIGHNYVRFTPSSTSVKQLNMRNLPLIIDESVIEEKLLTALPSLIKPKNIYIKRKKLPAATSTDAQQMQNKLSSQFGQFTRPSKMIVNVNCPVYGDPMWRAVVYFESSEDGEKAFKELFGKLSIDSVLVQLNAIKKSHLFCRTQVVAAVMGEIEQLKREFPTTVFSFNKVRDDTMVDVGYSCKSMEELFAVQQKLSKIFQGCTIQCQGNKKFSHLFTVRGHQLISEIQNSTMTLITLDDVRKVISIHGPKDNCARAQVELYLLVEKEVSSKKKIFNLKNSSMPTGFLKCLYLKYGIDLQGLICDFGLKAAVLNAVKGTLTIEGSSGSLRKVEEHLEAICTDLYNKHQTVKLEDGKEACDICLDPLSLDFHRLENCGHAFCKECLLLQVESKTVPIVCVKQDCGKDFFIVDIKTLLSRVEGPLRKQIYDAALQHHVNSNIGKLSYCPIPDCNMVYRVSLSSSEAKQHCAGCQNTICRHCHTPFHYGMSCDMFKKCTEDEDYSLKVWMSENLDLRKQCPKCQVVIEKDSGCNHMECYNCQAHMCWLCLELFPEGKDVYNHLPICPNNQGGTQ